MQPGTGTLPRDRRGMTLEIFPDQETMSRAAARFIADRLRLAVEERGAASLALSGGSTPRQIYRFLAATVDPVPPWERIHLFWGDERWVPSEDRESNFALARETILDVVDLPPENIHAAPTDSLPLDEGALRYEAELRGFFAARNGDAFIGGDAPTFDVIHLGLGEDGHTASLFPGDPVLLEADRWVMPVISPAWRPPPERVTFTLPLIGSARAVLFTAAGRAKREVIRSIVSADELPEETSGERSHYPAKMVTAREEVAWFVDEEAVGNPSPTD